MAPGYPIPQPDINGSESFDELARKLAVYIIKTIRTPVTFEQLQGSHGRSLEPLCSHLARNVHHKTLLASLLALKGHFAALAQEDAEGVNIARGFACEHVAIRCILHMSDTELIEVLLEDPPSSSYPDYRVQSNIRDTPQQGQGENSPLLGYARRRGRVSEEAGFDGTAESGTETESAQSGLAEQFKGLNALEIAAVCEAKKFLGHQVIQRIVTAIWDGDIVFWSSLSANATKQAHVYKSSSADSYSRLRHPKYLKTFEVLFFIGFLILYYMVLVQRSFTHVTTAEVFLFIWVASFAHNELGEYLDAGAAFYLSDFWTLWDVGIVITGFAFLICRIIGLLESDQHITDVSFDILAVEALFLVPRSCSLLSLHPYFGTLLPCLRDMTKDFLKFLSLVVILYLGFLTTFSLLGRDQFTFRAMSWILVKVFFGSSYLGFDVAEKISPVLGPPLMLIFVCLTNILLITSLISILSNSLTKVIEHASDEYKFVYSVFVLEASTSNRLTYFIPPLNLIPLVLRPLRLFISTEHLRTVRIWMLKTSHFPHVKAIQLYEKIRARVWGSQTGAKPRLSTMSRGPETPDRRPTSKRFSRNSRLFTPRTLAASNLKPSALFDEGYDNIWNNDSSLPDALDSIKTLEATVAKLTRQVEYLSSDVDGRKRQSAVASPL